MKKITLLGAVTLVSSAAIVGCGQKSSGDKIDSSKAQLTILTYDGGVGDQWLKNAAQEFELANQESTRFEDGKVGVQIHITKQRIGGNTLIDDPDWKYDMYFTESVNYYAITNKNKMADITDILTTPNPDDGGKTILEKIDPSMVSFMNRSGKYYAVPFYDCLYGFVYDKDLFQEKKFYMTDAGGFTNDKTQFGKGPNDVKGDWDDGLPKTYDQFKKLLNQMVLKSVTPFTYTANSEMAGYLSRSLASYWSDDEGIDNTSLNYTFNGTATDIVKVQNGTPVYDGNNNPVTEEVAITEDNGYLLRRQAGVYNALNFAKNTLCASPSNYTPAADVAQAQVKFVCGKQQGEAVGMLIEGSWWENEAVNAFDMAKSMGVDSFNYGFMPIPKSSDSKVGQDATLLNLNESYGFIKAGTKHMKLAKEFFSFLHTDAQLRAFTEETGMTRALDYQLEASDYEHASTFTKDLISIKNSEKVNMVFPTSSKSFFIDNPYIFKTETWLWSTVNKGENPIYHFITDNNPLSAKDYFKQHIDALTVSNWNSVIGK